jgi:hypothetical protein
MHRRAIITNVKFAYLQDHKALQGKLKYFQHREDKHLAQLARSDEFGNPISRWTDRGLGDGHENILRGCLDSATTDLKKNVAARLLVIAPEVHFMEAIPQDKRASIMRELTSATVETWFDKMGLPAADYAFVIHESEPSRQRPDGQEKDERDLSDSYFHSHVVLSATVPGLDQERQTYRVYENQIRQLHEAGREAMEQIWTRELGPERVAELDAELEARTQRYLALDAERLAESLRETPLVETSTEEERTLPVERNFDLDLGLEID